LTQKYSGTDALSRAEQGLQQDLTAYQQDIQFLFTQLTDLIGKKLSPAAVTPSQRAVCQRYQDVIQDLKADYEKSVQILKRARERHELLGGAVSPNSGNGNDPAMDSLLRERNHISNSMNAAASVIGQAEAVRSDLHGQGRSLRNTGGVMAQIAGNIPGLNTIVEHIRRRRSQDDKIVAVVIASCIVFTLWYVLG
jgi:golgi SNAP receptor complex member 1